jgi:hypothetical protein
MARLAAVLLAAVPFLPGADIDALRAALRDGDPGKAADAAEALADLGRDAAPAAGDLAVALDREWTGPVPRHLKPLREMDRLHLACLRALAAVGEDARGSAPAVARHLDRSPMEAFRALVAVAPREEETLAKVTEWFPSAPIPVDGIPEVVAWLRGRGAKGIPALAAAVRSQRPGILDPSAAALARLGPGGEKALAEAAAAVHRNYRPWILEAALVDGRFPAPLLAMACEEAASAQFLNRAEGYAKAIEAAGPEGARLLGPHLRDRPLRHSHWALLFEQAPALAAASAGPWLEARRAEAKDGPALLGGGGGSPFQARWAAGERVVGLEVHAGTGGRGTIVRGIRPLLLRGGEVAPGELRGAAAGEATTLRAPPGYALGGLVVMASDRVEGLAPVWLRCGPEGLDPADARLGPWCGRGGKGTEVLLGGDGRPVLGFAGRCGASLDAIGLLLGPAREPEGK